MAREANSAEPTDKEQRVARRAAKVGALKRDQSQARRHRTIGIAAAWSGVAIVLLVVVLVVITSGTSKDTATPAAVDGV